MAKKFAAIDGLHSIFNLKVVEEVETNEYDLSSSKAQEWVNHNTICFVTADRDDVDKYIANHKITSNDRFIIAQGDVFSLYGSLEQEPVPEEQTWRPIYINGESVIPQDDNNKAIVDFGSSEYLTASSEYNTTTKTLAVKYDIDLQKITELIEEMIPVIPPIESVYDGQLQFETPKEIVHTDDNYSSRDIEIKQNTIKVKSVLEEQSDENEEEPPTEEVEGNFSANTPENVKVKIHYKGTADRVDWYVENEQRNELDPNNATAKKFLYIECLQDYFEPSLNYPYLKIREDKKHLISEDSIVFITCGSVQKETSQGIFEFTDAKTFKNPEYEPGARFIWTHNKMFSANTWMPIFTRETEYGELKEITPVIGTNSFGGRLIFQGKGGITVDNTVNDNNSTGEHDRIITIDGSGAGGGSGRVFDTDVYIARDIPIGGTRLGEQVLLDGIFADYNNVVPANMTLHEVLYRLLYGESKELPYYIGAVGDFSDVHDFSTETGEHGEFITSHIDSGATDSIKFEQKSGKVPVSLDPVTPNTLLGNTSRQFIVAVPTNQFSSSEWLDSVLDNLGSDWKDVDNVSFIAAKNTINIESNEYYVYTISVKKETKYFTNQQRFTVNTKNRIQ